MDLITCLHKTDNGADAIVTLFYHLSKYTYFVPVTTSISADDLALVFLSTVVAWYGVPEHLILDCDPRFVSAFWKGPILALGALVALFTMYHPQMDGQSKHLHRSLELILCCFVSPRLHDWDLLLPCAEFTLNSSRSTSTGFKPSLYVVWT